MFPHEVGSSGTPESLGPVGGGARRLPRSRSHRVGHSKPHADMRPEEDDAAAATRAPLTRPADRDDGHRRCRRSLTRARGLGPGARSSPTRSTARMPPRSVMQTPASNGSTPTAPGASTPPTAVFNADSSIAEATLDSDLSDEFKAEADITLSSESLRANAGLTILHTRPRQPRLLQGRGHRGPSQGLHQHREVRRRPWEIVAWTRLLRGRPGAAQRSDLSRHLQAPRRSDQLADLRR